MIVIIKRGRNINGRMELVEIVSMVSGRWKLLILYSLATGKMRFTELKRALGKVTHRILTKQLSDLEADGLVHRRVTKAMPRKVEYSLTDLGKTLLVALERLRQWAKENETRSELSPNLTLTETLQGDHSA